MCRNETRISRSRIDKFCKMRIRETVEVNTMGEIADLQ